MNKYYAPALDKGLDILEFLSAQPFPQSQLEIANGIEKTPNEIYRMLISLEKRGYIAKDLISGKYSLTLRLFHMAHSHSVVDTIARASEVHMENLALSINQSVHLSILYQNKLLVIAQARSRTPVSLSVEIGSLFPLEKTISGRVILANMDETKRSQLLESLGGFSDWTAAEKEEFYSELRHIKGKVSNTRKSMLTEGVTDFASPIFNMRNEIVCVLAVSTLTSQMRKLVSQEEIENELVETAQKIRETLGLK